MPRSAPTELRYAGAALGILLAAAIRHALDPGPGDNGPLLLHCIVIAASAWFGGLGPLLLVLALAGLSVAYSLPPRGSPAIAGVDPRIGLAVFAGIGTAVGVLSWSLREALRRSRAREAGARRALQAERDERVRLRTTLASIADAVITADADGRVTGLNRAAEQLTGWAAREADGRPLGEVLRLVDGATRRTDEMPVAEVVGNGTVLRSSDAVLLVSRDGRSRPVEHTTAPIQGDDGRITGMVLVFRDITERCRAEQALRDSEERFRQLAEHISGVFWIADPRLREMLYVSPAYETVWGRTCRSLYREPRTYLEAVHPEDRERILAAARRLCRGRGMDEEYRVIRPDGTERWVWDRGFPIRDGAGRVVRVAGIAEDITERKRSERALHEADRRKDEFLALLAHELRNPLAPIAAALHLMGERGGPAIEEERAMAERQVRHMARLIDDLMDVSRISRGKVVLRKEAVDLAALVGRAAEAVRPLLAERRQELNITVPEAPVPVEADPTRLEQVVTNLLHNAAKYTDPGGRISLSAGRDGGQAVVRVVDTGIGIEPSRLGEVFGLFVQVERRLDRSRGGLGIGLGLVKSLVELHGGSVEARSAGAGRGSEFVVRLPAAVRVPSGGGLLPRADGPPGGELPARRVLVVDDNVDAADGLGRLLSQSCGQEVRVAYDGPTALEEARAFRPEVVLLDIGLPGMDGCEVARRLRREPVTADVLLVAVTGWGQESDREMSRAAGFDRHLVKPVPLEELRGLLADAVLVGSPGVGRAPAGRELPLHPPRSRRPAAYQTTRPEGAASLLR